MIKECLFPVAGLGTRFLPVTKVVPKELLPIVDKPLIHYGVHEAKEAGIDTMVLVTNKYKPAIKKYFELDSLIDEIANNSSKRAKLDELKETINSCEFNYVYQKQMLGLGHAILQAKRHISGNFFSVILPDDICHSPSENIMRQMLKVHSKYPNKNIIAVQEINDSEISKYGVVEFEALPGESNVLKVTGMVEKPKFEEAPSNLAIIGRYILNKKIFQVIEDTRPDLNNEIQITSSLQILAENGDVLALKFEGYRFDCGNEDGFINANSFFYNIKNF